MAAVPPSVAPSLASEYAPNNAWLTQDITNPTGKGPVSTGPSEAISDPVNGTAPVALNPRRWTGRARARRRRPRITSTESAFPHAGPWPSLPEEGQGKEAVRYAPPGRHHADRVLQGPAEDRGPGADQGDSARATTGTARTRHGRMGAVHPVRPRRRAAGLGAGLPGRRQLVAGHPAEHRPDQDRAGAATRRLRGVVAQYGDLASSGGNTAYEPPAPPAVSTQQPRLPGRRHDPAVGVLMARQDLRPHRSAPPGAVAIAGGSALAIWFAYKQHKDPRPRRRSATSPSAIDPVTGLPYSRTTRSTR